jgi:hypothetical protein
MTGTKKNMELVRGPQLQNDAVLSGTAFFTFIGLFKLSV